jgi:predicted extracellular nuclease
LKTRNTGRFFWRSKIAAVLLAAGTQVNADVVINEVLGSTTGSDSEYIELFNSGDSTVDISGWQVELWESDSGSSFGNTDAGSPYIVPNNTVIEAGSFFLFANELAQSTYSVNADVTIRANAIENSSYTMVLRDTDNNVINTIFVTDGGASDQANIAGTVITPDLIIGPDGSFLPAGFNRVPDASDNITILEFSPQPSPSGTPTSSQPPVVAIEATIMQIQGEGHTSPLEGEQVTTSGVVTAVDSNGFYLQDINGDDNIATSDALFVFTGRNPSVEVGQTINITGSVSEYTPGGVSTRNLSATQISSPTIEVTGTAELPAAIILGNAGRPVPNQTIDDDAFASFDPETDGIDYFESLEAMRVVVPKPLAVSPTSRFLEIFTVADNGSSATGLSNRETLNISPDDFNPEKIQIDADSGILPDFEFPMVNSGARFSDITGVISYDFGNFQVHPTEAFSVTASNLQPESTSIVKGNDRLTVASYNLLNLDINEDDGDTDVANGRFAAIATHIVNNLNQPDVIGLQEIQDNNGSEQNEETSAEQTLQALVDAIKNANGIEYAFADTPNLVANSVGGQPGGNIRVAFLYNPERVKLLGDAEALTDTADQATNSANPFFGSRISLAANFEFNGETITVVNNHLSSKGGSAPIFGIEQPFDQRQEDVSVNGSLDERQRQANAVNDFVKAILANNDKANVIVLGDMNEFEFVSPIQNILGEKLVNTTNKIDEDERYSFIFQGNSQQLDHILLSDALKENSEIDIVHVNSEFAETTQRASDHDPLVSSVFVAQFGDLDRDGDIDRKDRRLFRKAFRSRQGQKRYNIKADFDQNGKVNFKDYRQFLKAFRNYRRQNCPHS